MKSPKSLPTVRLASRKCMHAVEIQQLPMKEVEISTQGSGLEAGVRHLGGPGAPNVSALVDAPCWWPRTSPGSSGRCRGMSIQRRSYSNTATRAQRAHIGANQGVTLKNKSKGIWLKYLSAGRESLGCPVASRMLCGARRSGSCSPSLL